MKFSKLDKQNIDEVSSFFAKTFSDSEGNEEGKLIGNLVFEILAKTPDQDFCGYVVVENEQVIGAIIFSTLYFDNDINAVLLSPVAVSTDHQGIGIGQKLINFGISSLRTTDVELVFTYGDPSFYSKIGFTGIGQEVVRAPFKLTHPQGWLGQSLLSDEIKPIAGKSRCIAAFNNPELW